jgi:hypothetical protein
MAFVAAATGVGAAVLGTGAAAGIGSTLVGGALIGAGVGGLYSGITGDGDILNSMLTGGLIGGAAGGLGGALFPGAAGYAGAGAAGTGLTSSAAAAMPSTAAVPTANVLTPTAAQIAGSTAAPIGTAGQAASGFGLSAAPAKSAFGTLAAPTSTTATQMASNLGAKTLSAGLTGKEMLGYGLAGSAALSLLGGSGPGAQAPASATYPGDVRPYQFAARPTGQNQYPTSQYDSAGNPILDTQERNYFDQSLTPLQAYRAGTANPNPVMAAQGGLMAAYPMEKYGNTIPNTEVYGLGMAQGGGVMAAGGQTSSLGGYSDGGRLLKGPGDGVSDNIPAVIGNKQPARLADGEFVIPARIVSELGNGSTDAGAKRLYAMMDKIQAGRKKTVGKGKVAVDSKAMKHLPA